ncbi:MAG: glycosyltransferase [Candidatus Sulfomarinibacteraceae bacterium]
MNDRKNPAPGPGLSRSDLEHLVDEVQRRVGRLEEERTVPVDRLAEVEAELGVLREAVADLSAGILDLENQLIKLVSSCERLLAGAGDASPQPRRGGVLRRSASVMKRAVGRTIGAVRRLAGSKTGEPAAPVELRVKVVAPVRRSAKLAVVVRVSGDPGQQPIPTELQAQTDPELVVVVWNEETGKAMVHSRGSDPVEVSAPDRSSVAHAAAVDFVADFDARLRRLHPATLELCRWTVASEGVPLIVADGGDSTSRRGFAINTASDWSAAGDGAGRPPAPKLVKVVAGRTWGGLEDAGAPVVGGGAGRGYVVGPGTARVVDHRVAELDGVVAPAAGGDDRPGLLILTTTAGGEIAAWLVRTLKDVYASTVVVTDGDGGSALVRGLTELAHRVYPVAGFLEPEVRSSVVGELVRSRRIENVIRIGAAVDLPSAREGFPAVVDLPLTAADVSADADRVLALGDGIAEAARAHELDVVDLIPAAAPPGEAPAEAQLGGIRAAYGVPDDARLVVTICDLEPAKRPEDVAAVARRLRGRDDLHFLVVGRGRLAGSLSDLAGYYGLERFTFAPPGHPVSELVAVGDCVLSTAEADPWPAAVSSALALGRSVVATDIDGVRELAADAGGDRCALRPVGDVDGLAEAVVEALDTHRKPRATKKAWQAAASRSERALTVVREALRRGRSDNPEQG